MDITMQKMKKRLMKRNFAFSKLAIFTTSALGALSTHAGNLTLQPTVSAETIFQQIDSDTQGDRDINTLRIEPSLKALYESGKLRATFNGTGTHLERDTDNFSNDDDYFEYSYSADYEAIDRLLTLSASGGSSYRNANTDNYLVSDFLNNSGDLARTDTNTISARSEFTRGPWVAGTASLSYSTVKTEDNEFTTNARLNNDTISAFTSLENGHSARSYIWKFNGDYSDTDRENAALGSFESYNTDAFVDKMVFRNWAFRVRGQSEAHTFSTDDALFSNDREFDSVGAGITYRQGQNRSISLTANKASSSNQENDGDVYPDVRVNWAFTDRTSLNAEFGKSFYGDAASVEFKHATRKIRTTFSYSEDVSNFSQLLSTPESLGIFVCPGSFLSQFCYQPTSLDYQLETGEQLIQLVDDNNALEDNVILRKNGLLQVSYQSRRLRVGVYAQFADDDYLAAETRRKTKTYGTNFTYDLGVYTSLNGDLSFANIERDDDDGGTGESDNTRLTLSVNHKLSRYFSANLGYSYIDREGTVSGSVLGNNYTDQRLTLGVVFRY